MVQIPVGGGKFGEIVLFEGSAVQLPEATEFFPHGATSGCRLPRTSISDGKVDKFLETGEGTLCTVFFPVLQRL